MAKDKVEITMEIEKDHLDWITDNASEFTSSDNSKIMRILLDYAIQDVEAGDIFAPENMRCRHCG